MANTIIVHITISGIMPRSVLTLRRNMKPEPSSHENLRDFNLRQSLWTNTQDRERLSISAPPLPRYWSYRLPFTLAGSRVVHASAAYLNLVQQPQSLPSPSESPPTLETPCGQPCVNCPRFRVYGDLDPNRGFATPDISCLWCLGHHFQLVRWSPSVTWGFLVLISDLLISIYADLLLIYTDILLIYEHQPFQLTI